MFQLLKNHHAFRYLFLSRIFSVFADSVMFFSLLKILEMESGTNKGFIYFYLAFYLPLALFSLPAGAWIHNKTLQKVMLYSKVGMMLFLLLYFLMQPIMPFQMIYVFLILISFLSLFFMPANQSLLPHIVDQDSRPQANGLIQLGYTFTKITGQLFTATMIKLSISPSSLLIFSVILLFLSSLSIIKIKPTIKSESKAKESQLKLIKDGLSYVMQHRIIRPLFIFLAIAMLFVSSVDLLLISYLTEVAQVGVENLSFIGAASLTGMTIGALIAPKIYGKVERKWIVILPLFALGMSIAVMLFSWNWVFILPFFLLQGIALGCYNVSIATLLQEIISVNMYTRTFSLMNVIMNVMVVPAILLTGLLLSSIGVVYTIAITASLILLTGVFAIFLTPSLNEREEMVDGKELG